LTIALVLAVLSVLGFVSSYTLGWLAHILLAVAVGMMLVRAIYGRTVSS
jgi:hypothetical protein